MGIVIHALCSKKDTRQGVLKGLTVGHDIICTRHIYFSLESTKMVTHTTHSLGPGMEQVLISKESLLDHNLMVELGEHFKLLNPYL